MATSTDPTKPPSIDDMLSALRPFALFTGDTVREEGGAAAEAVSEAVIAVDDTAEWAMAGRRSEESPFGTGGGGTKPYSSIGMTLSSL